MTDIYCLFLEIGKKCQNLLSIYCSQKRLNFFTFNGVLKMVLKQYIKVKIITFSGFLTFTHFYTKHVAVSDTKNCVQNVSDSALLDPVKKSVSKIRRYFYIDCLSWSVVDANAPNILFLQILHQFQEKVSENDFCLKLLLFEFFGFLVI
jgi:hypothetical protein